MTFLERLLDKVEITETCWLWTAAKNHAGYGVVAVERRARLAHRVLYTLVVGPIPDGHELDHLCCAPACVNPSHLEAVTGAENLRRQGQRKRDRVTHCKQGHEFTPENTGWNRGARRCLTCHRNNMRRARAA